VRDRWYDPERGSWLSPDPVGYRDSSNLYAFAGGDPVNGRDPTGTCKQKANKPPCIHEGLTVTAKNPSEEEHFLFLQNETKELDLPFMGDYGSAHLFPESLWSSYQTKQAEKLAGHPVTPGMGVVLIGTMLVGGRPAGIEAPELFRPEFEPKTLIPEVAETTQQLAAQLRAEHEGLSEINSINALRGPQGSVPEVTGSTGKGADISFRRGPEVLKREIKVVEGKAQGTFNSQVLKGARQVGYQGEVLVQVPPDTDVAVRLARLRGAVPVKDAGWLRSVHVTFVDPNGNIKFSGPLYY
jgi:hypothetical protein